MVDQWTQWQPCAASSLTQSDTGYTVRGGFLAGLEEQLPQAEWFCVTQEFGTLAPLKVLKALRDENLYHHQARGEDPSHPVKRKWRRSVSAGQAVGVSRRSFASLTMTRFGISRGGLLRMTGTTRYDRCRVGTLKEGTANDR